MNRAGWLVGVDRGYKYREGISLFVRFGQSVSEHEYLVSGSAVGHPCQLKCRMSYFKNTQKLANWVSQCHFN